ncbi:hypothetical protein PCE1_002334 [Barthelona sp. PCE]
MSMASRYTTPLGEKHTSLEGVSDTLNTQISYNNTLLQQIQQLEETKSSLNHELSRSLTSVNHLRAELDAHRREAFDLRGKLRDSKEAVEAANEKEKQFVELTDDLNRKEAIIQDLRKEMQELEPMKAKSFELNMLKANNQDLKDELKKSSDAIRNLQQIENEKDFTIRGLKEDISTAHMDLNTSKERIASLSHVESEYAKLQDKHDATLEQNLEMHKQLEDLATYLDKTQLQTNALSDRVLLYETEINTLSIEKHELMNIVQNLESENMKLTKVLDTKSGVLSDQLQDLEHARESLLETREQLLLESSTVNEENAALKAENQRLKTENDGLVKKTQETIEQYRRKEESVVKGFDDRLLAANETHFTEIENLQMSLGNQQNEITLLHDKLRVIQLEKASQFEILENTKDDYERKAAKQTRHVAQLEDDLAELESQLQSNKVDHADKVDALRAAHDERMMEVKAELMNMNDVFIDNNEELEELREGHYALTSELDSMTTQFDELNNMYNNETNGIHYEMEILREKLAAAESKCNELVGECRMHRDEVQRVEGERDETQETLERMTTAKEGVELQMHNTRESMKLEYESTVQSLTDDLRQARDSLLRKTDLYTKLNEQLMVANKQRVELQQDVAKLQAQLHGIQEKTKSHDVIAGERVSTLEMTVDQMKTSVKELSADNNKLSEENHSLKKDVAAKQKIIQDFEFAKTTAMNDAESYRKQLGSLNANMEQFREQLSKTQSVLFVVQQERKQLQSENARLRADLGLTIPQSKGDVVSPTAAFRTPMSTFKPSVVVRPKQPVVDETAELHSEPLTGNINDRLKVFQSRSRAIDEKFKMLNL